MLDRKVFLAIECGKNLEYTVVMTAKELREFLQTSPFRPFRLHLADGKSLPVPHADFVLAGADMAVIAHEAPGGVPGELNFVPYEHIVRVEFTPRRSRKAA